jgi:thiamine-monophosphate kinase
MARDSGKRPIDHALHDGEDFELVYTASGEGPMPGSIRIGRVVAGKGVTIENDGEPRPLTPLGWEHHL